MLELIDYVIIFLLGSLGGFLSGFLGVGGGIVYVPILEYFLAKQGLNDEILVKYILANSLFTIIFSGTIASYKQYKAGNFFPRQILLTALPGMVTAFVMTYLIQHGTWYSKEVFNYVFVVMLLVISLRMFMSARNTGVLAEAPSYRYSITGFFAGMVTALSGLGGGVIMTPIFTDLLKQPIKKASSVSNGVIPMFALIVGILNVTGEPAVRAHEMQLGYIVFPVALPLIASAIIFAPIGVNISHKVSQSRIRLIFASFVFLVFIRTFIRILLG